MFVVALILTALVLLALGHVVVTTLVGLLAGLVGCVILTCLTFTATPFRR